MDEITCPNCNCDVGREELRKNGLLCPTCGFDLSDVDEFDEDEDDESDEDEDDGDAD